MRQNANGSSRRKPTRGAGNLRIAADLYVAAFLTPKTGGVPANRNTVAIPTTAHVWDALSGRTVYGPLVGRAQDLAAEARAFHWPLEFPDVMAGGGFDVVIGNPPWERIKLQEKEFFAPHVPEIAEAPNKAARERMIAELRAAPYGTRERALYEAFELEKRAADAVSIFARVSAEDGGRFPLTGRGDINTYALFAELFVTAACVRGRAGVIVPTGILTDDTFKLFFQALIERLRLVSAFSFSEIRRWFPATDDRKAFCLLCAGEALQPPIFVFGIDEISELSNPERRFTLSADEIARLNPNTKTAPVFRSRADAELTAKIYARTPILVNEAEKSSGNPWGISFLAMFHMSNDSTDFRTAAELRRAGFTRTGIDWLEAAQGRKPRQGSLDLAGGHDSRSLTLVGGGESSRERYIPLYEAKMMHLYDHRFGDAKSLAERPTNTSWPRPTRTELSETTFEPTPWYWVNARECTDRLNSKGWHANWLIGWRRNARAIDERTFIVSALPKSGVGDNVFLLSSQKPSQLCACLLACLSSLD